MSQKIPAVAPKRTVRQVAEETFLDLVRAMTSNHAKLKALTQERPQLLTIIADSDPDDHGKIIGAGGSTFRALSTVLALIGAKNGVAIKLVKPRPPGEPSKDLPPFTPADHWDNQFALDRINGLARAIFQLPYRVTVTDMGNATVMELEIQSAEKLAVEDAVLAEGLSKIFLAIGKQQGRDIFVNLVRGTTGDGQLVSSA